MARCWCFSGKDEGAGEQEPTAATPRLDPIDGMTTQRSRGRRFERILGAAALAAVLAYGAIASASLSAQSNDRPLGLAEGDHALALEHDGRSRRYIVRVPRLSRDRPPAG